jgi:hypothetical protein
LIFLLTQQRPKIFCRELAILGREGRGNNSLFFTIDITGILSVGIRINITNAVSMSSFKGAG